MYKLGDQFTNNSIESLVSSEKAMIRSTTYRITVLTERLVRLEYSDNGVFNNYETTIVKNRKFDVPDYVKQEDDYILKIETRYFILSYLKKSPLNSRTLKVKCKNIPDECYYGQKEVKNYFYYSLIDY